MTVLEQELRRALHGEPMWLPEPYGPDVTVFGPRQPERAEPDYPAILRTCRKHGVQWRDGEKCWCCAAGIKPLKN